MLLCLPHCVKSVQILSFFWSVFSSFQTEYGEIHRISPYSVRMQENTNQKKLPVSIVQNSFLNQIRRLQNYEKKLPVSIVQNSFLNQIRRLQNYEIIFYVLQIQITDMLIKLPKLDSCFLFCINARVLL